MTAETDKRPLKEGVRGEAVRLAAQADGWLAQLQPKAERYPWLQRLARWTIIALAAVLFAVMVSVPLDLQGQLIFGAGMFVTALLFNKLQGRFITLAMIVLSIAASSRYMYWRVTETIGFEHLLDAFFGFGLLMAELYAFLVLLIGYFQTAWPLQRRPVPMPQDLDSWPHVDIFIPTYNEPLEVVKQVVFSADTMDWPREKLHVYLLDDGRRDEFRAFCEEARIGYITRDNNAHAKAGNINAALKQTNSEYVAIFDCDHIPTRSFLQICMGWFFRDPKLALIQTPHTFFSPDPFEKNLNTFHMTPNEGELFYGIVQDGNDLWNAAFFCGSCAIIKREPLEAIGGIAVETVTEDAHTALKLSRLGYNTAYLQLPQAAGLATESLSGHVGQRIRWARGMAQIARVDNPLLGKGLSFGQRLCYFNAMLHFFYGVARIVFLTAPLAYLYFGAHVFQATAAMVMAYAMPHLAHANLTNSRVQGQFRYSFWNEVYESVLAWYITRPVLMAFINPKLGKFNVTAKGGVVEKEYFDWMIARPYLVLLLLNLLGFVFGIWRMIVAPSTEVFLTVLMNMLWTGYNVILTSACMAVASESRQRRKTPRVTATLPATLQFMDGKTLRCETADFSQSGIGLRVPAGLSIESDTKVFVTLYRGDEESAFPATVRYCANGRVGLQFADMPVGLQTELARLTFARADAWLDNWGTHQLDRPLTSLGSVIVIGLKGFKQVSLYSLRDLFSRGGRKTAESKT